MTTERKWQIAPAWVHFLDVFQLLRAKSAPFDKMKKLLWIYLWYTVYPMYISCVKCCQNLDMSWYMGDINFQARLKHQSKKFWYHECCLIPISWIFANCIYYDVPACYFLSYDYSLKANKHVLLMQIRCVNFEDTLCRINPSYTPANRYHVGRSIYRHRRTHTVGAARIVTFLDIYLQFLAYNSTYYVISALELTILLNTIHIILHSSSV